MVVKKMAQLHLEATKGKEAWVWSFLGNLKKGHGAYKCKNPTKFITRIRFYKTYKIEKIWKAQRSNSKTLEIQESCKKIRIPQSLEVRSYKLIFKMLWIWKPKP
jgi:hypothetical protein